MSIDGYQEAYYRERSAREVAEGALEDKARELYYINEQLKTKQTQLIISEKMSSLGQISAGIAHEINNPHSYITSNTNTLIDYFNHIIDFFSLLKSEIDNIVDMHNAPLISLKKKLRDIWQEKDFDYILSDVTSILHENEEGLRRIRRIVDGMKGFSHSADSKSQHVNLKKCLDTVLKVIDTQVRNKCKVKILVEPHLTFEGFQDQISQVLMNMIMNGAQAMKKIGIITINAHPDNSGILILIKDNGNGISPENLEKLFTPFFTTKPVGVGTGLGLSLCYEIIKAHNGTIEVESKLGVGTTFKIWLPVCNTSDSQR